MTQADGTLTNLNPFGFESADQMGPQGVEGLLDRYGNYPEDMLEEAGKGAAYTLVRHVFANPITPFNLTAHLNTDTGEIETYNGETWEARPPAEVFYEMRETAREMLDNIRGAWPVTHPLQRVAKVAAKELDTPSGEEVKKLSDILKDATYQLRATLDQ